MVIISAQFALKRGEAETALNLLKRIEPDSLYYIKAQAVMADIYLFHRNDKRMFINCYRRLVDSNPTIQACLLLGDAYMRLQEVSRQSFPKVETYLNCFSSFLSFFQPEKAIKVYQTALDQNPADSAIAGKIGKALITTHDYSKVNAERERQRGERESE